MDKLEQLYLEGFEKGYWNLEFRPGEAYYSSNTTIEFKHAIYAIEREYLGNTVGPESCYRLPQFQSAMKKWDEIKASPLYEALK